jgi:radical SAM superfamily enzyme YgiQ (UPF0313 family)
MNVLLISANQVTDPYPVYPLGLDYVAGAVAPKHKVKILDLNLARANDNLKTLMAQFDPKVIGLSLRNIDNTDAFDPKGYHQDYRDLVRRIRSFSRATIVLGGSGFTIFADRLMRFLKADYGLVGEGERMADLLDALENDQNPASLTGVVTQNGVSKPAVPLKREFYRRFNPHNEHLCFYLKNGGMLNLQSKRGCPFRCVYCTYPQIEGNKMRRIDPLKVAQTALELEKAGARYIFMTDSAFNADVDHSLAVGKAFGKVGLSIPWGAFFSPIDLPQDYFNILAQNGLSHVEFGTESLCDQVLAAYGKPFRSDTVFRVHWLALKAKVHVAHYLLFGGPGETGETVAKTLRRMDKLKRSVLFLFCGMRIYPNTPLYQIACRKGQIFSADQLLKPVFYQPDDMHLTEMAALIRVQAKRRTNWIVGAGDQESAVILPFMYRKGYSGPLWEKLIRS